MNFRAKAARWLLAGFFNNKIERNYSGVLHPLCSFPAGPTILVSYHDHIRDISLLRDRSIYVIGPFCCNKITKGGGAWFRAMSKVTSRKGHAETASIYRIYIACDSNRKKKYNWGGCSDTCNFITTTRNGDCERQAIVWLI